MSVKRSNSRAYQKTPCGQAHPQANNQVEAVNKLLKRTLKKELEAKKGGLVETTTRAIIPVEVGVPTHRVNRYTPKVNVEQFSLSMVLLEEHRLCAALHLATYQP
ncbi:hypothetical protein L3X38_036806 [Prunus dulcis]|uniref:Uncharacterized protein n=1 Tax=Prunus dulcis TaxID=3755 RepID=A0AAD4V266_PRUDU|nr:hypothetical protein L3X38_036806 [Prunus dulcis]